MNLMSDWNMEQTDLRSDTKETESGQARVSKTSNHADCTDIEDLEG